MRRVLALWAVSMFAACSTSDPDVAAADRLIDDAATALGGAERLRSVNTMVIEGEGNQYNLGQVLTPEASGQTFVFTQRSSNFRIA
jgi:hypothetical protein